MFRDDKQMKKKTIMVSITKTIAVEVPSDLPIDADTLRSVARWKLDDTTDGRRPFSTELIEHGAGRGVAWIVEEAVFHHVAELSRYARGKRLTERNALVGRITESVRCRPIHGIEVSARIGDPAEGICPACGELALQCEADDGLLRCNKCGSH